MPFKEERFYAEVDAYDTVEQDYIVPDGKILYLKELGGDAVEGAGVVVKIVWDPGGAGEIPLFYTHESHTTNTGIEILGDGVKVIRITLDNQDSVGHSIGAYWIGDV